MKTRLLMIGIMTVIIVSVVSVILVYHQEIQLATGMVVKEDTSKHRIIKDPLCFSTSNNTQDELCYPLDVLSEHGCSKPILEHLARYSNLIEYEWQNMFLIEWVSLPGGTSEKKFDECVEFLTDQRTDLEHYSIEITGMKDIYRIGEQYDFSYVISGYGYSCGSKKITFPDQNGDTMTTFSSSSCIAGVPMKEFVIDSKKQHDTTSVHGIVKIPGIYNVTVTFDRPSQDSPTTAIKEFRVPPINSWYNNQLRDTDLQTVMDSCANDSPKERMTNALRYTNDTWVFLNSECEWKRIGAYLGE